MTHSPGPWTRCKTKLGHVSNQLGLVIYSKNTVEYVCRLFHPLSPVAGTTSFAPSQEVADANGNVIAAAPELLEACEEMLRTLTAPSRELLQSTRNELEPWVPMLRQAIAKAKGETE